MSREFLGENESVFVPTPKVLDHDQGDTLSTAVVEVGPVFGRFACIDGGGGAVGRLKNDGFLCRRRDTDVEGNFASVHPVVNVDVRRSRERTRDKDSLRQMSV